MTQTYTADEWLKLARIRLRQGQNVNALEVVINYLEAMQAPAQAETDLTPRAACEHLNPDQWLIGSGSERGSHGWCRNCGALKPWMGSEWILPTQAPPVERSV